MLQHPGVLKTLKRSAEQAERANIMLETGAAVRDQVLPPLRPSRLVLIGLHLAIFCWAIERTTHRPGSIFDPALFYFRSTIEIPARVKGLVELYRELSRYRSPRVDGSVDDLATLHILDFYRLVDADGSESTNAAIKFRCFRFIVFKT